MDCIRIINVTRMDSIQVVTKDKGIYVVFQDGRHNRAFLAKDLEYAQAFLRGIERSCPTWVSIPCKLVEVKFSRED